MPHLAIETLLILDVISDFEHEDGERLLSSLRDRAHPLALALAHARANAIRLVYVNDAAGRWDGDAPAHVASALAGSGGDVLRDLVPDAGDRFLFKAAYSAFNGTALPWVLDELGAERVVLAGAATEMCVAQTAIDARERGLQVTVLADACASVDVRNEQIALDYLENVTGTVVTTTAEWIAQSRQAIGGPR
jgi:nicotinamidase-related amidase